MKNIELIAHWIFAFFMATISYAISMLILIFIMVKSTGLPFGVKAPADLQPQINPTIFPIIAFSMIFLPMTIASLIGTVSAPNSQRKIASIIFPALVFLVVNFGIYTKGFDTKFLLETFVSCFVVTAFFYLKSRKRLSEKGGVENGASTNRV